MIAKIKGKVLNIKDNVIFININGICYEVLVPKIIMDAIEPNIEIQSEIELVTYHYYQMEHSRSIPILIGFKNEIEKEFFEDFISVSGIGPKAACKALVESFSVIADAIDSGDVSFLKKLPGVGNQKARLIIAKLQGKVGKFGLIKEKTNITKEQINIKNEALAVLLQLQYTKIEAEDMIRKAILRNKNLMTSEELLNEVYKGKKDL